MECLVCDGTTKGLHSGMEVCRACVVFYRRMQKRAPASCRSKGKCREKNASCMKCRYDRFTRLMLCAMGNGQLPSPDSTSLRALTDRPLLSAISEAYRDMCRLRIRMESEAFAQLPSSSVPLHPTTFVEVSKQVLRYGNHFTFFHASAIGDFAAFGFINRCFTGMEKYTADEKVEIVRAFHPVLIILEMVCRNECYFPGEDNTFCSFTTINTVEGDYFPGFSGNRTDANKTRYQIKQEMQRCRKAFRKMEITDEVELTAALGLMLLDIASMSVSEASLPAIANHRLQLLRDLQSYYREMNTECDCASRIGSLVGLTLAIRGYHSRIRELLLVYYVIGVIAPDSGDYKLIS